MATRFGFFRPKRRPETIRFAQCHGRSFAVELPASEMYANNRDWPGNNLKKWRSGNPKTKWKWFLYDMDFGMGDLKENEKEENDIYFFFNNVCNIDLRM